MLLALTIVAFVVIIATYVPWVNLLCFTEAIYHVVKIYETNEAPLNGYEDIDSNIFFSK